MVVASIKLTLPENSNQPIEYLAYWNADTDARPDQPLTHTHNVRVVLRWSDARAKKARAVKKKNIELMNCDANSYVCMYLTLLLSTFFQFVLLFVVYLFPSLFGTQTLIILNKSLFDLIWNAKFALPLCLCLFCVKRCAFDIRIYMQINVVLLICIWMSGVRMRDREPLKVIYWPRI